VLDAVSWHRVLKLIPGVGKVTATDIVREIHNNRGSVNFSSFNGKKYFPALQQLSELINRLLPLQQNPVQAIENIVDFYKPMTNKYLFLEMFCNLTQNMSKDDLCSELTK
jgi:DNA helicase-2/ATP-dependent DNA helicase PcrA